MPLSYRTRLRRDLRRWQERGLILPEQAERIAADALAPRTSAQLQTVLVLCLVVLFAPAIIAFVAANWAAMSPQSRLVALFVGDAATVLATYLAARRLQRDPEGASRALVDGLATLSLAFAAATLALVGQTFHVPSDPGGFAAAVAGLGLATALITRSGGATLVACLALAASDILPRTLDPAGGEIARAAWPGFWIVGPGLFLASLSGWLPARTFTLLLLLLALTNHLAGGQTAAAPYPSPAWLFMVAALALILGRMLAKLREAEPASKPGRPRLVQAAEGGEALAQAATDLCLVGILAVALNMLGFGAARHGLVVLAAYSALAAAVFALTRPGYGGREAGRLADWLVIGAAALALTTWLIAGAVRGASPFLTVWGGVVPALALVVAGHVEERRSLIGGGLVLCGGLTLGMLAMSGNLIAFSGNLLLCAALVAAALAACRWTDRRLAGRAA